MYKVLIVEDEDIMRKGLMFMPKWQEIDCIVVGEAANGKEGLEKSKNTNRTL
jgi:two component transcriptional regulator, AraC family